MPTDSLGGRHDAALIRASATVYVVDDDNPLREALRLLIHSVGLSVETWESAYEFLEALDPERPGCLILDVRMPGMSGLDLMDELNRRGVHLPVIIITAHGSMRTAVQAMQAGAMDCIDKPFSDQLLLDRIQQAIFLDDTTRRADADHASLSARLQALSPRERQIMTAIVGGKTSKNIADELGISKKTVDSHRAHVMEKMRARTLADLVQIATKAPAGAPPDDTQAATCSYSTNSTSMPSGSRK
ncbi:MAG: response regulator [Planctomycetota bacterium]|nr:response regulator [Planctomycetota bacterium]